jgi:WD40 repeat protein
VVLAEAGLGARAGTLTAHDGGLLCATVSPDGRFLVTAGRKGAVKVWGLASWKQAGSLGGHTKEVRRAVFSRDGRTLATCSSDGTVRLWKAFAARRLRPVRKILRFRALNRRGNYASSGRGWLNSPLPPDSSTFAPPASN